MLLYLLVVLVFIAIDIGIWYLIARFYVKDDFILLITDNMKRFWKSVLWAFCIATLACSVQLFRMGSCQTKGWITNANTQYSWVMKQCQAKNSTGVYVDIERTRGTPGDEQSEPH